MLMEAKYPNDKTAMHSTTEETKPTNVLLCSTGNNYVVLGVFNYNFQYFSKLEELFTATISPAAE
jgi:hypothetical protein